MLILVVFIILSLTLYLFYKVRYVRTRLPMEKRWLSAKCNIALGMFVAFFGANIFFVHLTAVGITIAVIFLIIGLGSAFAGYKAYRHYLPFAIEEAEAYRQAN
jgi:YtpI-like protein